MTHKHYVTYTEAAKLLGGSRRDLDLLISTSALRHQVLDGRVYIEKASLDQHLAGEAEEHESLWDYTRAAAYLGVPRGTLHWLVHRRRICFTRLSSRLVRFRRADLDDWLRARTYGAGNQS